MNRWRKRREPRQAIQSRQPSGLRHLRHRSREGRRLTVRNTEIRYPRITDRIAACARRVSPASERKIRPLVKIADIAFCCVWQEVWPNPLGQVAVPVEPIRDRRGSGFGARPKPDHGIFPEYSRSRDGQDERKHARGQGQQVGHLESDRRELFGRNPVGPAVEDNAQVGRIRDRLVEGSVDERVRVERRRVDLDEVGAGSDIGDRERSVRSRRYRYRRVPLHALIRNEERRHPTARQLCGPARNDGFGAVVVAIRRSHSAADRAATGRNRIADARTIRTTIDLRARVSIFARSAIFLGAAGAETGCAVTYPGLALLPCGADDGV